MADIALDGSIVSVSNGGGDLTQAFTINNNSNRLLIVGYATHQGQGDAVTIKWNGTDLTKIVTKTGSFNETCSIWALVAPETGTHNIVVDTTGGGDFTAIGIYSLYNCKQVNPSTFQSATGSSNYASLSIVTPSNDNWVIDAVEAEPVPSVDTGTGQVQDWAEQDASYENGEGSHVVKAVAGTQNMGWNLSYGGRWNLVALVVEPSTSVSTYSETFTIDGIVKQTFIETITIDGIVTTGVTKTFTVDGIISTGIQKTFTVNGIVKTVLTKTLTVDGIIVSGTSKYLTLDGIVKSGTTKTFTIDGVIVLTHFSKTFTLDGIVHTTQSLLFTVDGYIQANTGYFLNGVQIAKPKSLKREFVFLKTDMTTIPGKLRRDVSYRKEKYILEWEILTLIEVSEILSAISQNKKISFRVNEANLQIGEVNVWPFLKSLDYSQAGSDYRASAVLELVEEIV